MAQSTRPRGLLGETLAQLFLESRGYRVLAKNCRAGRREVDLVVERALTLVAVEVKWRRADALAGTAPESWRAPQRARAGEAVLALMETWPGGARRPWRFDLVTIEEDARGWTLRHYPGAWAPRDSFW